MFQHYNLFPHMSVLDNVTLAARKVHGWDKDRARERGLELLDRIGLKDKAKEYPDRLSGGQQQRVAIARALATHPELLLLDEITAALDPVLVGEVLDLVREIKAQGSTILMATHEISFARQAADRVVFLRNGQIVEQGPPEQVIDHPHPALRHGKPEGVANSSLATPFSCTRNAVHSHGILSGERASPLAPQMLRYPHVRIMSVRAKEELI